MYLPARACLACLAVLLAPGGAARATEWHHTVSPHFVLNHESAFAPSGLVLDLERIHNRLRLDLSMFAPWMAKERVEVYLHKDRNSYVRGEFEPPSWSNGIAQYEKKRVVSFERSPKSKLLEVLSHELTHLFFESYWAEGRGGKLPVWLNEGLAMMEEARDRKHPEKSEWFQAMVLLTGSGAYPFDRFVRIRPTREKGMDQDAVTLWYVQAHSVVYFLYREHTRLQFFNFCKALREGTPLERTLWKVYRYHKLGDFQKAWVKWINSRELRDKFEYVPAKRTSASRGAPAQDLRGSGKKSAKGLRKRLLKKTGFRSFQYDSIMPEVQMEKRAR